MNSNLTHPLYKSQFNTNIYKEIHILKSLSWEWEYEFDIMPYIAYTEAHYIVLYTIVAIYLSGIIGLKQIMKNRKPLKIPIILITWNFCLFLFSLIGFFKVVCWVLYNLIFYSHWYLICAGPHDIDWPRGGPHFFWVFCFVIPSKIIELGDTVLLIIRKKPVTFLHWFHHFSVLIYCWHSFANQLGVGFYFSVLNLFVHTIMYYYYFLCSLSSYKGIKAPKWSRFVTIIQITQMFLGINLLIWQIYYNFNSEYCHINWNNWYMAFAMYLSYFFLFISFYFGRYFYTKKEKNI